MVDDGGKWEGMDGPMCDWFVDTGGMCSTQGTFVRICDAWSFQNRECRCRDFGYSWWESTGGPRSLTKLEVRVGGRRCELPGELSLSVTVKSKVAWDVRDLAC